jgi:hypothetical protein
VSLVRIHCYGCARTVLVDEGASARGLAIAGWSLSKGETYCPQCAAARGLSVSSEEAGEHDPAEDLHAGAQAPPAELTPFPLSSAIRERRGPRAWRLLQASFSVLRDDPQLLIFPGVSMALSLLVGALSFALSNPSGSTTSSTVAAGSHQAFRATLFLASLIAAFPVTFVSLYCGVALAAVLAGRLEGKQLTAGDGWTAARQRLGIIAAWALVVCTVGALLRLLEQRLPLVGRLLVAVVDLSWTLATMFAVPVLAYENLGPMDTFKRSSQIFKQRWGTQIGGVIGIGVASLFIYLPFILLIVIGAATAGSGGVLLVVLGGAGLFGAIALQSALDQIFRVFVYRSAIGLDTSGGPFAQSDLQAPFSARKR